MNNEDRTTNDIVWWEITHAILVIMLFVMAGIAIFIPGVEIQQDLILGGIVLILLKPDRR